MRRERRSASFRKDRPLPASRALSWLSVSALSKKGRRLFRSHSDLRAPPPASGHSCEAEEDDDDWIYQPQHHIGK